MKLNVLNFIGSQVKKEDSSNESAPHKDAIEANKEDNDEATGNVIDYLLKCNILFVTNIFIYIIQFLILFITANLRELINIKEQVLAHLYQQSEKKEEDINKLVIKNEELKEELEVEKKKTIKERDFTNYQESMDSENEDSEGEGEEAKITEVGNTNVIVERKSSLTLTKEATKIKLECVIKCFFLAIVIFLAVTLCVERYFDLINVVANSSSSNHFYIALILR